LEHDLLQPQLDRAQAALEVALDEACGVNLGQVNTDELVRIEETLVAASTAAKEVVSIRLLRRQRRARAAETPTTQMPAAGLADVVPSASQRIFEDIRGTRWRVFAVHPSGTSIESGALPDSFRGGWLSFESADEKRRVAPIPDGWSELSVDDLRLLCLRAQRAPKRSSGRASPPPTSSL
jgi:hypothetical protein